MDLKYKGIDNKPSLKRLVETLKKALEDSRVNPAKGYVRKHATDKEYIEAIRFQAEGHISALQTQHPELTLPQTANNLTALREIIAQGEKILDGKSVSTKQTTTPQTGNGGGDSNKIYKYDPHSRILTCPNGKKYEFNPSQGTAINMLYEAWKNPHKVTVLEKDIGSAVDSFATSFRLISLFRISNKYNQAWADKIIERFGKGSYRLKTFE